MIKIVAAIMAAMVLFLTGCSSQADVASENLSKAADQFEINRRIVFVNGITDKYLLEIDGLCSLGNHDGPHELSVTCKVGPGEYEKHFLGLSDNVTYFVQQIQPARVSTAHYRVLFRPSTIVPDITIDGHTTESGPASDSDASQPSSSPAPSRSGVVPPVK